MSKACKVFKLSLHDLEFTYAATKKPVLSKVNMSMCDGEFTWITGANSSGKSTLLSILAGVVPRVIEGKLEGTLSLEQVSGETLPYKGTELNPAMVMQDANVYLFRSVFEEVAFPLENRGVVLEELDTEVEAALNHVGILKLKNRLMHTLSGGERQKVAVAAALAVDPKLLLLDEPFEQLDPASVKEVLELAAQSAREGAAVVVATRDASKVPDGSMTYHLIKGTVQAREAEQETIYTRPESNPGDVVLTFDEVTHRYSIGGGINKLSFAVHSGESLCILGPNGAGKTTLMKHAIGLLRPHAGVVSIDGADIVNVPVHEIASRVGILFQNPDDLLFNSTVEAEVAWGLIARGIKKNDAYTRAEEVMQELGIAHLAKANPHEITGSERQLVAFASVLVTEPQLIILDEPTKALDALGAEIVARAVDKRLSQGAATLIVTHDMQFASRIGDRTGVIIDGELVEIKPTKEILQSEELLIQARLIALDS